MTLSKKLLKQQADYDFIVEEVKRYLDSSFGIYTNYKGSGQKIHNPRKALEKAISQEIT